MNENENHDNNTYFLEQLHKTIYKYFDSLDTEKVPYDSVKQINMLMEFLKDEKAALKSALESYNSPHDKKVITRWIEEAAIITHDYFDIINHPESYKTLYKHKQIHKILNSCSYANVDIKISMNNREKEFKYSRPHLNNYLVIDDKVYTCHAMNRLELEGFLDNAGASNRSSFTVNDIIEISYRKRILYKDKSMISDKSKNENVKGRTR